ncbi:MAG: DUF1822 family protein [Leptolyngbyaceae cyanobacterium SM1_1_3]|nr:DUF1822 family protein [Leptolyngbyaceae cyanobacterium SM1_1_3]
MIAYPDNLADFLEHEALDLAAVEITPAELSESAQLSQSVYQTNMQWQSYLNSLAMTGFERWLSERSARFRSRRAAQHPAAACLC